MAVLRYGICGFDVIKSDRMKQMISLLCVALLITTAYQCNNRTASGSPGKLKGRLVIKEICAHYVVEVTGGKVADSLVTNGWKDDKRGKTYNKVFTVSSRCSFPATLNEGDEFEFNIETNAAPENCAVCMAFYPTPPTRNAIKIHPK